MVPIEGDAHVQRARHTAAWARVAIGAAGIALIVAEPSLLQRPLLGALGFALIVGTALVHLAAKRVGALQVEESLAAMAAVLIIGLGGQRVSVLSILWLAAVASGVMARGGRVHWIGRALVLGSLALPVLLEQRLTLAPGEAGKGAPQRAHRPPPEQDDVAGHLDEAGMRHGKEAARILDARGIEVHLRGLG